ncbi:hypothetical protein [uncultured Bifidobacterium sp.]|uniref:hypothetical protein n=1 Tax=uncultured Bifidobacterium sp. TaxID=165187 RepID=UPI00280BD2FF|nr:hypothetical protein [uncultured Bifidobacterium sp.]
MVSIGSDINRTVAWTQRCSFAYHADEAAEVNALNDISCAIPQGEIVILCGKAVLVVTHDYELAAQWCDRIIALEDELHNEQGEEEDRLAWTSM